MRMTLGLLILAASAGMVSAQTRVDGYTRQNGTYVAPHYRSNPDGNSHNNWSVQPNTNPYTGQQGTHQPSPSYGSGQQYGSGYIGNQFGTQRR